MNEVKFPLVQCLGLEVFKNDFTKDFILASDLEALLAKAHKFYAYGYGNILDSEWQNNKHKFAGRLDHGRTTYAGSIPMYVTHSGIMVCIQDIQNIKCAHEPMKEKDINTGHFNCRLCMRPIKANGWSEA